MKESKKIEEYLTDHIVNEITRKNYRSRLYIYYGIVGHYPDAYMDNIEKHKQDLRVFVNSEYYKKITKLTIKSILNAVVQFFKKNDIELPNSFENMITTRTKNARPVTKDRILKQSELKAVIMSGDVIERAMFSFLSSSGMRINAFSLLEINDIDFKTKPVTVHVRPEIAKGENERWVFIDAVASKYLKEYLDRRDYYFGQLDKYNYKRKVNEKLLFPITQHAIARKWRKLLAKNGLSEKDINTKREIYHIHTLRKRWKTIMSQHMPEGILNAIIGHAGYMKEAYDRYTLDELRDAYGECEDFITIEPKTVSKKEINGKLKEKDAQIELITTGQVKQQEEMDEYKQQIERQQQTINKLADRISDIVDASQKAGLSKYRKQLDKSKEEEE